ncbi:product protein [Spatholobus suberectus]|nr:product protein [Spatholobus suberectus]
MGGGNGQKSKMARERNLEKLKAALKVISLFISFSFESFKFLVILLNIMGAACVRSGAVVDFNNGLVCAGSQLETNKKAMNIQCKVCMQTFMCTTSEVKCKEHAEAKHPKSELSTCFPHLKK